jgi:hypothetical protein
MNTKEAIEILETYKRACYKDNIVFIPNHLIDINEIIVLLQQGEKYRLEDEARRNYANHLKPANQDYEEMEE